MGAKVELGKVSEEKPLSSLQREIDNIKMIKTMGAKVELSSLQREIDKIKIIKKKWELKLNQEKCKKKTPYHLCKGRQIIDAGGADGEGQWSGKAAALLAQMQHNYSQENTGKTTNQKKTFTGKHKQKNHPNKNCTDATQLLTEKTHTKNKETKQNAQMQHNYSWENTHKNKQKVHRSNIIRENTSI